VRIDRTKSPALKMHGHYGCDKPREQFSVISLPLQARTAKHCARCKNVKPLTDFAKSRSTADGLTAYCKPCHNEAGKATYIRKYGSTRHYHLVRRYGIGAAEVEARILAQGGLCSVCREATAAQVDHDHVTKVVRGVLCFNCNGGLGQFKDRTAVLRNAIDYLETTTWQRTQVCTGVYRLRSPRPAVAASPISSELQHLICSRRG
jgi:5-methylcytosine-specific restriction endonuclease McrA